ncbi:DUF4403 family protein [Undibacter mobilis]|uniref:DUF4403 family protein n=1 Tax=Undibacter mobilis TaxID=2292256 RepID=A0A371BBX4_9BRAD|nr:DUF4403 family protein [Undibacter mobilis]RDV04851.1 DUF4403 family protein [Undibacter mobilis]
MGRIFDAIFYVITAPLRWFGRSRRFRVIAGALIVVALFFAATLWALDRFFPPANQASRVAAKLEPLPPLPPLSRPSYVIAPVAVSIDAIQRSIEASTPRNFSGQSGNPVSGLLQKADIGLTVNRGNMAVSGRAGELTVNTPLTGNLHITGQLGAAAGNLTGGVAGALGGLLGGGQLGGDLNKAIGGLAGRVLDQNVELRSQVTVRSRPEFATNWRVHPNLAAQISVADSAINIAGIRLNMAGEAKPLIEQQVNQQVANFEGRIRNDPIVEVTAREQWQKMCRSIPLGGGNTGLPALWLEMKPVRAAAAQPQIDARNVTLVIGVQAETRILAQATKPACPFPASLELVPPMENGKLVVGVPIDVPFTELNKLINAQLKGKRFPEDASAAVEVEVLRASLAAADDRLLISLRVKARERKSWFGFGAEADVDIWGRPKLDPQTQILRLTDISLAVETEAAYGLLGTAARAAMPYLQQALADNAMIDLTPFLNDAKKKIGEAMADFRQAGQGVAVDTAINSLRLNGIAFDSNTLRIIAEAEGTARISVTQLPRM